MAPQRPVLGILVSRKNWNSHYIRSVLRTAEQSGVKAFRLTPEDLQSSQRVEVRKLLPTVVYNRIPTRKEEFDPITKAAKGWLARAQIPVFNSRFFNKREVDRCLRKCVETAQYLPTSWYSWEPEEILSGLHQFGSLYVKPISGSLGEGIYRLEKMGSRFFVEMRSANGVEVTTLGSKKEFFSFVKRKLGHHQWIIQEEIPLRTYRDRKTDFRVHVQRKPDGEFTVTGCAAKVAAKGAVTTHVRSGGSIADRQTVLDQWFHKQADAAYDAMEKAALTISRNLCDTHEPTLGELGLDMGFSRDGRLVLFEANAKPGRSIFHTPFLRDANAYSLQLLVDYAVSLSENEWKTIAYQGVVS